MATKNGFTLLEVLVVVSLLSLIVIALMSVFSGTQRAFRASLNQTDVLGGGRATVDLMASDLRNLAPCNDTNLVFGGNNPYYKPVNFLVMANSGSIGYTPLMQSLTASPSGTLRANVLNYFFALGRDNTKWTAVGYVVDPTSTDALYPLYRFYAETNITISPGTLFSRFQYDLTFRRWSDPAMSHVLNGVVDLKLRAYDPNGEWMNYDYYFNHRYETNWVNNVYFAGDANGEGQLVMFDNLVPAAVDLEIGVLEKSTLDRAESRSIPGKVPWQNPGQWSYLTNQIGALHIFRQRVLIPNVDPSAYQ